MVVGVTKIPWFSYGPFHAALGVMTVRMLLHVHKAAGVTVVEVTGDHGLELDTPTEREVNAAKQRYPEAIPFDVAPMVFRPHTSRQISSSMTLDDHEMR